MGKEQGNKVLKSGIWYTISSVAIRAVALITTPIYTSLLSPDDYGVANIFNSWIDLINVITCLCIVYSIGRAKIDFKDKFDEYMSALQGLSSTFAFVVLIFAILFREQLSAAMKYEVPLVIVLFVYLVISPSVEYMLQKYKYEYQYKNNIIVSLVSCVGTVFFSIVLIFVFKEQRYIGKIIGSLLTSFLMGIWFYIKILKKGGVFYHKEYWIYALKFGIPMIPHALALQFLAQIDRIMILDICSEEAAGLYAFGYSFATLLAIFTNAIGQAWLPWFNEQLDAGNKEKIREVQKKLVLLGVFLSIGFIAVAPEALMVLAPNNRAYWVAKYVVPPVALGTLAQYFYTNYVNVELFYKRTPLIAVSSVMTAGVNYVLNLLAIKQFGYIAAAYTTLISYIFLMVFHYIATRYVMKKKIYANMYMFVAMITAFMISLVELLFYAEGIRMIICRYLVTLLILGIFAFMKRRDIMLLLDFVKKKYFGNRSKK